MSKNSFATCLGGMDSSGRQTVQFTPDWSQGRAAYGGLVAAVLLKAMRGQVPADRKLRSMTVSFVGPVAPEASTVTATVLRQGKSVTQVEARITQGDAIRAVAFASFGADRESGIQLAGATRPDAPDPAGMRSLPNIPGVTPTFLQHFQLCWTAGLPPFSGADSPDFAGWCRHAEPTEPDDIALVGLLDVWPPSVLPMMKKPAPASSLTWSIDLLVPESGSAGDDWWFYDVKTQGAGHGFVQADARLWLPDGRLGAVSRQTAVVFDQ